MFINIIALQLLSPINSSDRYSMNLVTFFLLTCNMNIGNNKLRYIKVYVCFNTFRQSLDFFSTLCLTLNLLHFLLLSSSSFLICVPSSIVYPDISKHPILDSKCVFLLRFKQTFLAITSQTRKGLDIFQLHVGLKLSDSRSLQISSNPFFPANMCTIALYSKRSGVSTASIKQKTALIILHIFCSHVLQSLTALRNSTTSHHLPD